MSFSDFFDPDELLAMCRKTYAARFRAMADNRCPYLNEEDMIQAALIRCWRLHERWRPDGGQSKRTWLQSHIVYAFMDQFKLVKRRRYPTKGVFDIADCLDVAEDHRIIESAEPDTNPRLFGRALQKRTTEMMRLRKKGWLLKEIGLHFGVSDGLVSNLLTERDPQLVKRIIVEKREKILKDRLAAWKKLAIARGKILVAYRLQSRTPFAAIDAAGAARKKLDELGEVKG